MKTFKIWLMYTTQSFQLVLTNKILMILFLLAKTIRISLFLLFLIFLFKSTKSLGGYSQHQIIFFYLSYNLIDTTAQLLFREVYRFRSLIISGNFDFVLSKPVSPLLKVLIGGSDPMDMIMLVGILLITIYYGSSHISTSLTSWLLFGMFYVVSILIAMCLHIFVLGLGIVTFSIDHLIMMYRDLTAMARIPIDIYLEPVRSILSFVVPLAVMFTLPPKVLMGLVSLPVGIVSLLVALLLIMLSKAFWSFALRSYQSASS